jgi:hypothetical protein
MRANTPPDGLVTVQLIQLDSDAIRQIPTAQLEDHGNAMETA